MAYDAAGRVSSVTDPVTGTTGYTYGLLGERLTMTLPGGGTWTYNYDSTIVQSAYPTGKHPQVPGDDPDQIGLVLNSITDDQGRRVEYGFDERGVLSWSRSDEVFTTGGAWWRLPRRIMRMTTRAAGTVTGGSLR